MPRVLNDVADNNPGIIGGRWQDKKKTLFIDAVVPGNTATEGVKKYTDGNVATMCRAAIRASMKNAGSTRSVRDGSYSVHSQVAGQNICVHVTSTSCWPVGITVTGTSPGKKCA